MAAERHPAEDLTPLGFARVTPRADFRTVPQASAAEAGLGIEDTDADAGREDR